MRSIVRNSLAAFAVVVAGVPCLLAVPAHTTAAKGGVTITPATLTISLAKGAKQQTATFAIANSYDTAMALHLSFAQPVSTPGSSALKQLSITPQDLNIAAGETAKPVITLTDSDTLAPGSQQIELVVSQITSADDTVAIVPSVRMPLSIIKLDGAVSKLSAGDIATPTVAMNLPETISLHITNTGNMTTIPRGYVSIRDPRGHEVQKGIINTASAAVTAGSKLQVTTAMAVLGHAWLPGIYRVQATYGLGGGTATQTASASFFYLPLWHILLVLLFGAMAYCGWQIRRELARLKKQRQPAQPAKPHAVTRRREQPQAIAPPTHRKDAA